MMHMKKKFLCGVAFVFLANAVSHQNNYDTTLDFTQIRQRTDMQRVRTVKDLIDSVNYWDYRDLGMMIEGKVTQKFRRQYDRELIDLIVNLDGQPLFFFVLGRVVIPTSKDRLNLVAGYKKRLLRGLELKKQDRFNKKVIDIVEEHLVVGSRQPLKKYVESKAVDLQPDERAQMIEIFSDWQNQARQCLLVDKSKSKQS